MVLADAAASGQALVDGRRVAEEEHAAVGVEDMAAIRARGGEAADGGVAEQARGRGRELGAGRAAAGGGAPGGREQGRAGGAVVPEDGVRVLGAVARVEEVGAGEGVEGGGGLRGEGEGRRRVRLQGAVVVQDLGAGDGQVPDVEEVRVRLSVCAVLPFFARIQQRNVRVAVIAELVLVLQLGLKDGLLRYRSDVLLCV